MAKRKKRKSKKSTIEIPTGLYAVIFIIAAILGIGKLGPVGRLISSFGLFFMLFYANKIVFPM